MPYLQHVRLDPVAQLHDGYPFSLPFVAELDYRFVAPVTFLVGENGSGKSTLLEAMAVAAGFPISGGSTNEVAAAHGPNETSELANALMLAFRPRHRDGYFFRAELQAHFASLLDARKADPDFRGNPYSLYGGQTLHGRSHGEAFLAVMQNRFKSGLFLLDEPESALSPQRQLALLALMSQLTGKGKAQFVIATHSAILLTFPGAKIVSFDNGALREVALEDTEHYRVTKGILESPERYWRHLRE